jgi:hypothetical protein
MSNGSNPPPAPPPAPPPTGQTPPQPAPPPSGQTPPQPAPPPSGQTPPRPPSPPPSGQTPPQPPAPPSGQTPPQPPAPPSGQTPPAQSGSGQTAPGAGQTTPGSGAILTFKMKAIKQTERKTLVFEYHRTQAVQRQYAPQALFGLLAQDLTGAGHFLEVDLDDEFFRSLDVEVELMAQLEPLGVRSVAVSLDYGAPSDPRSHRHADMVFDAANSAAQHWIVPIGPDFDLGYRPRIEFHFDPHTDWVGENNEVVVEPGRVEDRTLQLDPTRHIGFLDIEIRPERLSAADAEQVEVELVHESSTGWRTAKTFVVRPESEAQRWRVRTASRDEVSYTVARTYHLTGGGTVVTPPETTSATTVAVGSPFATHLDRRIDFSVPPGQFESVIVDVTYDDPTRGHRVERRVELDGASLPTTHVQIGIVDPTLLATTSQATLIGPGGAVVRGAEFVGEAEFLSVAADGTVTGA